LLFVPPIRLLIADDSTEFRNSIALMLKLEADLQVVAMARDGQETVDFGRQFQPDVAVVDVHMPKVDGITAIRQLAKLSPHTACMVISYEKEREVLREAMAAGARDYLIKPFSTDELINAIRRVATRAAEERTAAAAAQSVSPATESEQRLTQLVVNHLKTWRTDDEAAALYHEMLARPEVDPQLLTHLAAVFLARRDWKTLRAICDRMDKLTLAH
jgi:DNA-binding NarL/FixJ family response regulator